MKFITLAALAAAALVLPAVAQAADFGGFSASVELGYSDNKLDVSDSVIVNQVTNINPVGSQPLTVVPGTSAAIRDNGSHSSVVYGVNLAWTAQSGDTVYGLDVGYRVGSGDIRLSDSVALPATALSPPSSLVLGGKGEVKDDWSVRAILGHAMDQTLFYVAAGVAEANLELRPTLTYTLPAGTAAPTAGNSAAVTPLLGPIVTSASQSKMLTGWTLAGGASWMVSDQTSVDLEVRYDDYGDAAYTFPNQSVSSPTLIDFGEGSNAGLPMLSPPNSAFNSMKADLTDWRFSVKVARHF